MKPKLRSFLLFDLDDFVKRVDNSKVTENFTDQSFNQNIWVVGEQFIEVITSHQSIRVVAM